VRILILSSLTLALTVPGLAAQGDDQEKFQENFAEKQKEAWFTGGEWALDLAAAKARAKQENKLILVYFTRTFSP
jgi:hypothetical protein